VIITRTPLLPLAAVNEVVLVKVMDRPLATPNPTVPVGALTTATYSEMTNATVTINLKFSLHTHPNSSELTMPSSSNSQRNDPENQTENNCFPGKTWNCRPAWSIVNC
jgi:hypothetical protein